MKTKRGEVAHALLYRISEEIFYLMKNTPHVFKLDRHTAF
ncbi:hypothetical protein GGP55_002937 [Salinibacter ruber]|nr:hypothetical protein [Salinibacter ruber]